MEAKVNEAEKGYVVTLIWKQIGHQTLIRQQWKIRINNLLKSNHSRTVQIHMPGIQTGQFPENYIKVTLIQIAKEVSLIDFRITAYYN